MFKSLHCLVIPIFVWVILPRSRTSATEKAYKVQLVNYLTSTGKAVGLVINFGPEHVEIKKKSNTLLKQSC